MKKKIFFNSKMYLNHAEAIAVAKCLSTVRLADFELAIFPNHLFFYSVSAILAQSEIALGAQNVAYVPRGAYTGAISAELYAEAGASLALVGHSERRYIFGETEAVIGKKLLACLEAGLQPVICIGETKEERDSGQVTKAISAQLNSAFSLCRDHESFNKIIIAYEPVYAIGTNDSCPPDEVVATTRLIGDLLRSYTPSTIPILYGGSVNSTNVLSYLKRPEIDGVLVGSSGASLSGLESFLSTLADSQAVL